MTLHVHGILPSSQANGPGRRYAVWVQGCTLGCPGCFNPETHPPGGGTERTIDDLSALILASQKGAEPIEGVTISGGEPLQQFDSVLALLQRLRSESSLSALLFTGYRWEEICAMPRHEELLASLDVVVAGRYLASKRVASGLKGSSNQTFHFLTDRYAEADLERVPPAEITIEADGSVHLSGVDPLAAELFSSPTS